ncbi:membrane-associated tyrosine- and threonine-specific cdc2-inhibitory kinase [Anaeramoeba flamelloides]|uniref:Membrane-associated tyrosine- and threonine-specific cdc2-inhibitory kinase n=1 Tax=Anaeramoeba flamelloides TaxID=1746091 RepID=A0AAV7YFW5_9EUKA|nr:membrane-associated tyrosine- and threonine-specific cdc2-inhibitory kinase [Anaeramoeba flamelloides]
MTNKTLKPFLIKPDPKRFASHTPTKKIIRKIQTPKSPRSTNYSKKFQVFQQLYSRLGAINPKKKENVFNTCFVEGKEIGTGSFSVVTRKKFLSNNKIYALKRSHQYTKSSDRKRFVEEVFKNVELFRNSSKSLGSKFVVRTHAAFEEFGSLSLVNQYCEGGSLEQYLNKTLENQQILPEHQIWEILTDSLLALEFIHSNGFVHMDIKPENILIHKNKYMLCDFGNMIKEGEEFEEGDSRYLAPNTLGELFKDLPSKKTYDIYSLGATIYQLSVGDTELPTGGEFWEQLRSITEETKLPYKCTRSTELKNITIKMMLVNENKRATLEELFGHKYIIELLKKRFGNNWNQRFSLQNPKNTKTVQNNLNSKYKMKSNIFSKVKTMFDSIYSKIKISKLGNENNSNDINNKNNNNNNNNNNKIVYEENILMTNSNLEKANNNISKGTNNSNKNNIECPEFNFLDNQLHTNGIKLIEKGFKNLNTKHSTKKKKNPKRKNKKKKKKKKKRKKKKKLTLFEEEFKPYSRIRTHSKAHVLMDDNEFVNKCNNYQDKVKNAKKKKEKGIFSHHKRRGNKKYNNDNKLISFNPKHSKITLDYLSSPTPKRRRGLYKKNNCSRNLFDTFENIDKNSIGTKNLDFDCELDLIDHPCDFKK